MWQENIVIHENLCDHLLMNPQVHPSTVLFSLAWEISQKEGTSLGLLSIQSIDVIESIRGLPKIL